MVIEDRLRKIVNIKGNQYWFQKGNSTTEPMFCIILLQEKYREYGRKLCMVFIVENVSEVFIDIIKDMCEDSITLVSTTVGETGETEVKFRLISRIST